MPKKINMLDWSIWHILYIYYIFSGI